jgi:hypothetical protein
MPSSKSSPSARQAEHTLGLTPSEVRLLLLAHLCMDEATGKVRTPDGSTNTQFYCDI